MPYYQATTKLTYYGTPVAKGEVFNIPEATQTLDKALKLGWLIPVPCEPLRISRYDLIQQENDEWL